MQDERKLHRRLGYTDAISESIDFRKVNGSSEAVLRNFSTTELYFKNAHRTVAKMMRLQWTQDLDIETLEPRGHWATMEELLEVVTFHLPCYENTVTLCKTIPDELKPSDVTFATKFVAICTFSSRWQGRTPWLTSIWQWTWWKQRRQTGVSSITKSSRLGKSRGLTPWFWLTDS